jgi:MraZ protein
MVTFIGEFDCKLDPKGRLSLPAGLYKQFDAAYKDRFVINRSIFQKCLILYPLNTWESIVADLSKLNRFIKDNDTFIRQFTNGAISVDADNANRLLLPKRLTDYASIEKEVILSANLNKIEIWSADLFNKVMDEFDQESFESLAEKVMSKIENNKS